MRIAIPSLLGIEALIAEELGELGYQKEQIEVKDGMVYLTVEDSQVAVSTAIARLNINLRCAERVQLEVSSFVAKDFDTLFDEIRAIEWEAWIPEDWAFIIKGYSRKSALYGVPGIQRTIKKGIAERLAKHRGLAADGQVTEDPSQGTVRLQFSIMSDTVCLMIDTSGDGLHKRGYRLEHVEAPLKETIAAAMIRLVRWEPFSDEAFLDPFCGSGTLAIEAALLAAGIPAGINRRFDGEYWPVLDTQAFAEAREEGRSGIDAVAPDDPFIFASDIDKQAVAIAANNAERAGIRSFISFSRRDAANIAGRDWINMHPEFDRCIVIGNPPYGERIGSAEEVAAIHRALGENFLPGGHLLRGFRLAMITASETFEQEINCTADRRRKLYNGMIKCCFYQYYRHGGQRPKQ